MLHRHQQPGTLPQWLVSHSTIAGGDIEFAAAARPQQHGDFSNSTRRRPSRCRLPLKDWAQQLSPTAHVIMLALIMAAAYYIFERPAPEGEAYANAATVQSGIDAAFISPSHLRSQVGQQLLYILDAKPQVGENWLAAARAADRLASTNSAGSGAAQRPVSENNTSTRTSTSWWRYGADGLNQAELVAETLLSGFRSPPPLCTFAPPGEGSEDPTDILDQTAIARVAAARFPYQPSAADTMADSFQKRQLRQRKQLTAMLSLCCYRLYRAPPSASVKLLSLLRHKIAKPDAGGKPDAAPDGVPSSLPVWLWSTAASVEKGHGP
jgi:hypothetical protein